MKILTMIALAGAMTMSGAAFAQTGGTGDKPATDSTKTKQMQQGGQNMRAAPMQETTGSKAMAKKKKKGQDPKS